MSIPKDQHFVPRSYLAHFTDPEAPENYEPYLSGHERGGAEPKRKAPHNLAFNRYYYSFEDDSGEMEHGVKTEVLGRAESAGIPLLRRLIDGAEPGSLSDEERMKATTLLAFMEVRTPRFRDHWERQAADFMKMVAQTIASRPEAFEDAFDQAMEAAGMDPDVDLEEVRQGILSDEWEIRAHPTFSLALMVKGALGVAQFIYDFEWRVLEAPGEAKFITSDAPFVKVATERAPGIWGVPGWLSPFMEATLPLDPPDLPPNQPSSSRMPRRGGPGPGS